MTRLGGRALDASAPGAGGVRRDRPAAAAAAGPTPDQAVTELNTWRTELGESTVSTTPVAAWDTGCQHHDNYEHLNGNALTHTEVSGNSGYTADGAQAGLDSVLSFATAFGAATPDAALLPGPRDPLRVSTAPRCWSRGWPGWV